MRLTMVPQTRASNVEISGQPGVRDNTGHNTCQHRLCRKLRVSSSKYSRPSPPPEIISCWTRGGPVLGWIKVSETRRINLRLGTCTARHVAVLHYRGFQKAPPARHVGKVSETESRGPVGMLYIGGLGNHHRRRDRLEHSFARGLSKTGRGWGGGRRVATRHRVQGSGGLKSHPTSFLSTIFGVLTIASVILNEIQSSCGV